jgi:hypothetical protein
MDPIADDFDRVMGKAHGAVVLREDNKAWVLFFVDHFHAGGLDDLDDSAGIAALVVFGKSETRTTEGAEALVPETKLRSLFLEPIGKKEGGGGHFTNREQLERAKQGDAGKKGLG